MTLRLRLALFVAPVVALFAAACTPPVSFQNDLKPIIKLSCAGFSDCHGSNSKMGMMDLQVDPYAALVNVPAYQKVAASQGLQRVLPGDSAHSFVYIKLTLPVADAGDTGPTGYGKRMPNSGQTLDPDQIDLFKRWIEEGAKNN